MKTTILIVEDEPILYERLRRFLTKENYLVSEFTKSYIEAIDSIEQNKPDLVLLDINLQGDKDGIDLGDKLFNKYKIPFIYVTDFGDEVTFKRALRTNPNIFEIKTKPHLDTNQLLRSIKTVLQQTKKSSSVPQEGIMAYVDYLDKLKTSSKNQITKVPISFKEIDIITTEAISKSNKIIEPLRTNYVRIETSDSKRYFFKSSLKTLLTILPDSFIRINESTIVNLKSKNFDGRINGSKLSINKHLIVIKDTYTKDVNFKIDNLFKS
ncbi:response regulator [uncultured Lutibacter sp.]|uniref:response regulator transcription factor n=1 Tax=uncultured Lutibacter sp. TaxID=437739 RepID=UPI002623F990|nr:response regulator [uncultured Lutibacter sp.]